MLPTLQVLCGRSVACRQQQGILDVGQHPSGRTTNASLDILQCQVIYIPSELSTKGSFDFGCVALANIVNIEIIVLRIYGFSDCTGC